LADGQPADLVVVGVGGLRHFGEAAGVDVGEDKFLYAGVTTFSMLP
jgi:hypothetical protein